MELKDKRVVITGGAGGIGSALGKACLSAGARVFLADRNEIDLSAVTERLGVKGTKCDVSVEREMQQLVDAARQSMGGIDVFVSNAGLSLGQPSHAASASNADWHQNWQVHVMAHVYAARALLPEMIERGSGAFVQIASAAGLLNQIGDAAYSATKHAAVSFAESLAIEHAADGIHVSLVCPQYVATGLLGLTDADAGSHARLLSASNVADTIVSGVQAGHFMILPHTEVAEYAQRRSRQPDGWLRGMQVLKDRAEKESAGSGPRGMYRLV
ncbi:MAG: SDR family oxidoreductase [Pseudomonadota bacterium]